MVKLLHTVVAYSTVGAAWRPPMVAGGTPFGLDDKAINLVLLEGRPAPASSPCCSALEPRTCCYPRAKHLQKRMMKGQVMSCGIGAGEAWLS